MEVESAIESAKSALALKEDFNLKDLFVYFDYYDKGYVDRRDLNRAFLAMDIKPALIESFLGSLISRYDVDNDERLYFTDVGRMFMPIGGKYGELVQERGERYYKAVAKKDNIFTCETQKLLGKVCRYLLMGEKKNREIV